MEYNNAAKKIGKKGWSPYETKQLLKEAELAEQEGQPLKAVFERVARLTGRKPNSIRNYYYTKIKEINPHVQMAFTPFTEQEVDTVVKQILIGQAQGKSVRKIAFELGGGDKKAMLRYQNKYRSILKTEPEYIEKTANQLEKEGLLLKTELHLQKRVYKKKDMDTIVTSFMDVIMQLEKEGQNLLLSLYGALKKQEMMQKQVQEPNFLQEQYAAVKEQYIALERINADFLALSAMQRISTLPEYVLALKNCIG